MLPKSSALRQIDSYLNMYIKDGFVDIEKNLDSGDDTLMYRAAHSQVGCTRMVGLDRLGYILDQMQKCVPYMQPDMVANHGLFKAYYPVLLQALDDSRSEFAKIHNAGGAPPPLINKQPKVKAESRNSAQESAQQRRNNQQLVEPNSIKKPSPIESSQVDPALHANSPRQISLATEESVNNQKGK